MSSVSKVCVIDGGFSSQLSEHVKEEIDGDPLWSAKYNYTHPEAIVQTHLDFLESGAEIILTNTYQASVEGYNVHLKMKKEDSVALIKNTCKLAHKARQIYMSKKECKMSNAKAPMIYASIGPYGAMLHDGSEYTGSYCDTMTAEQLKQWHKIRIDACLEANVEGLAFETIPCLMEAECLCDLISEQKYCNVKFWISFQCKDGQSLANGENFAVAAERIHKKMQGNPNFLAVGVNCVHPKYVSPLFKSLNANRTADHRIPLIVYANSGEIYKVNEGWTGDTESIDCFIEEWIALGAKYIGGCCRTKASDILRIKNKINSLSV